MRIIRLISIILLIALCILAINLETLLLAGIAMILLGGQELIIAYKEIRTQPSISSAHNSNLTLDYIAERAYDTARAKGWHENADTFGDVTALIHSEVSEAFEEYRNGHEDSEIYLGDNGKPEGIPIEFADIIIRVCHFSKRHNIDLNTAIEQKLNWNVTRPYKHGGKKL